MKYGPAAWIESLSSDDLKILEDLGLNNQTERFKNILQMILALAKKEAKK